MEINTTYNPKNELEQKRKLFVRNFVISIVCLLTYLSALFYFFLETKTLSIVFFVSVVAICYIYYIISKFRFDFKAYTDIGFAFFTFLIYLNTLFFWKSYPLIYAFYFLVPTAVYIVNGFKQVMYWSGGIIVLLMSTPFVSPLFYELLNLDLAIDFSRSVPVVVNFSIVTWLVYLLAFFLYYHTEFEKIKRKIAFDKNTKTTDSESDIIENELLADEDVIAESADNEFEEEVRAEKKKEGAPTFSKKYDELYNKIEEYFEKNKPYEDANFNIHKLVVDLNTNSKYILNALNQKHQTTFKAYLNNYRINEVKKKLDAKEHEKYTLKHIYNSVGFTNQSTFNRIFKEVMNLTPSEYIEQLK